MAEIILGMPGPWAENNHEAADHYTTKIGGLPDWPIEETGIDQNLLNCCLCGERLCLVAQVYAPISTPKLNVEERMIYVLGCRMPKCGSNPLSWRAIRVQKCHDEKQNDALNKEVTTLDENCTLITKSKISYVDDLLSFGHDIDGSDDDVDLEELGRAFSEIGTQTSQSNKQKNSAHSKDMRNVFASEPNSFNIDANKRVLPCFYIYTQKAQSSSNVNDACIEYPSLSIKETESRMKDQDENEKWEAEKYEYDRALGADRTYLKFKKQLDLYPEQCFRYSYGGKPLLAAQDMVEPNSCKLCGTSQQYEMQLMSPLLYFMHHASHGSSICVPEWSWMTLMVYTCSNNCCPSICKQKSSNSSWAIAEEAIVVQDE